MNFGRSGHWMHFVSKQCKIIHSLAHIAFWYAECVKGFEKVYMVLRQEWKLL